MSIILSAFVQAVSLLEQKETLDAPLLEKVAQVLGVTQEAIKNFSEEAALNIISSTLHDNAGSINHNCSFIFNPFEKIVKLFERMLQTEKEKNELLQKLLDKK